MTRSRYQVHADLRRVFSRHWIDLDRIHFGEYRGMVRVTGELHTTDPRGFDPTISILDVMRAEIMRIPEVRHVQFDLVNWTRDDDGVWTLRSSRPDARGRENQPQAVVAAVDGDAGADEGGDDDGD